MKKLLAIFLMVAFICSPVITFADGYHRGSVNTKGHAAVGATSSLQSNVIMEVAETMTGYTENQAGLNIFPIFNPAGVSNDKFVSLSIAPIYQGTANYGASSKMTGLELVNIFSTSIVGSSDVDILAGSFIGAEGIIGAAITGKDIKVANIKPWERFGGSTLTGDNLYGLHFYSGDTGQTVPNQYLAFFDKAENATNNYQIWLNETGLGTGINFGDASTRLFSSTSGTVSTDAWSDQRSHKSAGDVLDDATTPPLILAWITPATTELDLSGNSNDATYSNFATTDQTAYGFVWALSFYDGTDEYLTVSDDPAFSWDDSGANPWSACFWFEVVATANQQTVIGKYSSQATDREWYLSLADTEKLWIVFYDESADVSCANNTDAALSAGWHFACHVYDSTGGASAMTGTNAVWYVDGVAVADTPTNNGSYVAMEAGATDVTIGAYNTGAALGEFFQGDMGLLWIEDVELSAAQVWKYYIKTRGYYNL